MRLNTEIHGTASRLLGADSQFPQSWQWQPSLTAHDPAPPITIEDGATGTTYTFSGSVALAIAVSSPQVAVYTEPASAALAFGVASPAAVVYAEAFSAPLAFTVSATETAVYVEPSATALAFGVSSPQTAIYINDASVVLAFGVGGTQTAVYSEPTGVALAFGVASPVEVVISTTEIPISGQRVTLRWKPKPRLYEHRGGITLRLGSLARHSLVSIPQGGVALPGFAVRTRRQFVNVPPPLQPLGETDQLVLAGVL